MKKNAAVIALLFLFSMNCIAQSIFEDAVKLRKHIDDTDGKFLTADDNRKVVLPILKTYFPGKELNKYSQLQTLTALNAPDENPYLQSLIGEIGLETSEGTPSAPKVGAALSAIGGLDVTTFADALARFMVTRAKQELSAAFFEKFKKDLQDPRYSDLQILFPTTNKTLMAVGDDIYQFSAYLNTLREAFAKDLSQLIVNMPEVWKQPKYDAFFKRHPEVLESLNIMNELVAVLQNGKHPGDAIHAIADLGEKVDTTHEGIANYKNAVRTLDLVSQSLRTSDTGSYWVSSKDIKKLATDPILRKLYLGLLVQEEKNSYGINFKVNSKTFMLREKLVDSTLAKSITADPDQLLNFIYSLSADMDQIEHQLKIVKSTPKPDSEELYKLFNMFLDFADQAFDVENIALIKKAIPGFAIPAYFRTSVYIGKLTNEAYIDIAKKNYNSAVINVALIADTVLRMLQLKQRGVELKNELEVYNVSSKLTGKVNDGKENEVSKLIADITGNPDKIVDWNAEFQKLKSNITSPELKNKLAEYIDILLTDQNETVSKLIRYGTLAANIVAAKNSEEAEAAIEAMALPPGSARIKKEMKFSVTLNSYLGGFYGTNDFYKNASGLSYGVIGYTGVGANWGIGKTHPWSVSVYGNLIDIGALAAFRLNNDTSQYNFKIKLNQIVSPGGMLVVGLPCVPISVIAGYQYAPVISKITADGYLTPGNRGRFTLGLAVDIPLLNFYTREH
jgi:hypothetical protein